MNSQETNKQLFEIIEGCVKGDRKCQQIIYEKFYGKMLGACMRYSRNREEARDILQDGFVKVFMNIRQFGKGGSFEGWVRKIIVNTAIDFIRKSKKMIIRADSEYVETNGTAVTDDSDDPEYMNISTNEIMEAVQHLPTAYRTAFNMFVMDKFSHKEIAERLGINEGTSKSNLSKAKMNLKKALAHKTKTYQD